MNDDLLVTIIVPVYNVRKYIVHCIMSIIKQDYKNIEIILVDDGSTDGSSEVVDEYTNDDRIVVIHQKNGGVSSARNTGIARSHGSYIMFVDGDDWVETNYVSYFVDLVRNGNMDVGMNESYYTDYSTPIAGDNRIISADNALEKIYNGDIFVAVWNKIYKREFIVDKGIKFHEDIWFGEGMLFNVECLQYLSNVAVGERAVYHQISNPDSAMRSFKIENFLCGLKSMEIQRNICNNFSEKVKNAWELHDYCYNKSIIDGLVNTGTISNNLSIYKKCRGNLRENINIPLRFEKTLKRKVIWLCYFVSPRIMAKITDIRYKHRKIIREYENI